MLSRKLPESKHHAKKYNMLLVGPILIVVGYKAENLSAIFFCLDCSMKSGPFCLFVFFRISLKTTTAYILILPGVRINTGGVILTP